MMCGCKAHDDPFAECTCECPATEHADPAGVINQRMRANIQRAFKPLVDLANQFNRPTQESKMTVGPRNDAASELEGWWREKAMDEIMRTVPKAIEYGAGDLEEIGRQLVAAGVKEPEFETAIGDKRWHEELGVYFYMTGKMARWRSAIERGEFVSDDTLFDIGVYVRMVQRIRDAGGWPGVEVSEQKHENVDDERPVFD